MTLDDKVRSASVGYYSNMVLWKYMGFGARMGGAEKRPIFAILDAFRCDFAHFSRECAVFCTFFAENAEHRVAIGMMFGAVRRAGHGVLHLMGNCGT